MLEDAHSAVRKAAASAEGGVHEQEERGYRREATL
jgi:hypothetical protein